MWLPFILVPVLAVLALLLVLGAIAVAFAAVHVLPVLLILAGIWLLVKATRGSGGHQQAWAASRPKPQPEPRRAPSRPVGPAGQQPRRDAEPRRVLPIDVEVKAEQIRRKADLLLGYADRFPPFSHDLYLVRQTAADYLPRTLAAYLALPGRDDPTVPTTGATALQELRAQLQLLDSKLDDITANLQRSDLERLAANRRFLDDRSRPGESGAPRSPSGQEAGAA